MSDGQGAGHTDVAPELRQLAQSILDKLDPAVRSAAARAAGGGPAKCEQVWCPLCALAALINGEQHPLLAVVAEHSVALLTVVRAMAEADAGGDPPHGSGGVPPHGSGGERPEPPDPTSPQGPQGPSAPEPGASGPGHYQHIPIQVDDSVD